ncbi:hypothetical protein D7Y13_21490 [Corallococcus praedator]|uniref:PhoD-like phosphatase domain-containing protein n=1 Tax=Corallococcus praedator TaxID=2316724 RepID=A0ABX9QEL6_9BACT|nr:MULTISPECIES: alkaline phosphatase D family protein [Corallococcus]RKH28158.1 hypothetical protein D7X75_25175 [Corallococcus sp. CA031C]RKI05897.1 hypothetical protein D7Y13_21490 [Corallococcus praedator]
MKLLLGPILYAKAQSTPDPKSHDVWSFYVNVFLDSPSVGVSPALRLCFTDARGVQVAAFEEAKPAVDFTRLPRDTSGVVWRWEVVLPRKDVAQRLSYHFEALDRPGVPVTFERPPPRNPRTAPPDSPPKPLVVSDVVVPQRGVSPNIAFFSCNGASRASDWSDLAEPYALWDKMLQQHQREPTDPAKTPGFQLLIGGGDQLYADSLHNSMELLHGHMKLSRSKRLNRPVPDGLRESLLTEYVWLYRERWGGPEGIAPLLQRVPGLYMWDDHDIFDGWGSHEELQRSPWYRAIYSAAARAFEAFQKGTLEQPGTAREPDDGEFLQPVLREAQDVDPREARHYFQTFCFSTEDCDLDVVLLDLRSGRTSRVLDLDDAHPQSEFTVMSRAQWDAFDAWREEHRQRPENGKKARHVLVVSSVPLVHLRFGPAMEDMTGGINLRDDLLDQWESAVHRGERTRLLMNLFALSKRSYCAVTVLSGDVHVGARARVRSRNPDHLVPALGTVGEVFIEQVTSSPIIHPPPCWLAFKGMLAMSKDSREDLPGFLQTELLPVGKELYLRDRNWLSIRLERPKHRDGLTARPKLWVRWIAEKQHLPMEVVVEPPPFLPRG